LIEHYFNTIILGTLDKKQHKCFLNCLLYNASHSGYQ
jgi:hypothetical protein